MRILVLLACLLPSVALAAPPGPPLPPGVPNPFDPGVRAAVGDDLVQKHHRTRNAGAAAGFGALAGWGAASVVWGGIGLATGPKAGETFHRTNLIWGAVDLGIGAGGLVGLLAMNTLEPGPMKSLQTGRMLQTSFAVNLGLDAGYVGVGILTEVLGNERGDDDLIGAGRAVTLQGAVLLGFDLVLLAATMIHDGKLADWLRNGDVQIGPGGVAFRF
jgi:hypothetical protein